MRFWLVALAAALTMGLGATPAATHPGGIWFNTAANTALVIERKFPRVMVARCFRLDAADRSQYNAHSFVRGSVRAWDHFGCVLAPRNASVCSVVAHWTGGEWHQFVLTSHRYRGCSPYVLR